MLILKSVDNPDRKIGRITKVSKKTYGKFCPIISKTLNDNYFGFVMFISCPFEKENNFNEATRSNK